MEYLVSFRQAHKQSEPLQNDGFFDKVEKSLNEQDLLKLLEQGKAHNQNLGFNDKITLCESPKSKPKMS